LEDIRVGKKLTVPFGTISIPEQSKKLIGEILDTKRISSGKYVRMFEDRFAELLGVQPSTIRHYVFRKIIPYVKVGVKVRFRPSDIQNIQEKGLKLNR